LLTVIGKGDVFRILGYSDCIGVVRGAMAALSAGQTQQMLRQVIPIAGENVLSAMAGVMVPEIGFGAKIISVFPRNSRSGRQSHQGVVVLFDTQSGEPACVLHAGEITRIRTASASAVATDVLANSNASHLAVLGYGEQGQAHVEAISHVRALDSVKIWGRSAEEAARVAKQLSERLSLRIESAATVRDAVRHAHIVCTTTAAADPILMGDWIAAGTHLNLVGSSVGSFAEVDGALVARARFFADHREGVLKQGGEYLRAQAAGLVDEEHVLGEIGDVLNGVMAGRTSAHDVTAYKSLGHVVQDIASARYICDRVRDAAVGPIVEF
jgi:ornithine cyclodeaminase/alanine dehydrogenase-like protein (mu-crystallin family)